MIVGRLDKRLRVEEAVTKRSPSGAAAPPLWQLKATRWASIEPLTGQELEKQGAMESQSQVRIVMRPFPGLGTRHRLVRGTVVYGIVSVTNRRMRNRELEVMCTVVETERP